eukprot:1199918-Pleurochrysis_carterae.AAC.2
MLRARARPRLRARTSPAPRSRRKGRTLAPSTLPLVNHRLRKRRCVETAMQYRSKVNFWGTAWPQQARSYSASGACCERAQERFGQCRFGFDSAAHLAEHLKGNGGLAAPARPRHPRLHVLLLQLVHLGDRLRDATTRARALHSRAAASVGYALRQGGAQPPRTPHQNVQETRTWKAAQAVHELAARARSAAFLRSGYGARVPRRAARAGARVPAPMPGSA